MIRLQNGDCLFCWGHKGKSIALFLSIVTKKGWRLVRIDHFPEYEACGMVMTPPNEAEALRFADRTP